ncbi:hypothetical protein B0J18DRAFT_438284 [Chaetomium sp. MPI-SDFR-AT-0129]|nr:hypothetical protein B0J18DRAFT_438284 [Chaetomium sp. MPI-SDFR-AT-0129]
MHHKIEPIYLYGFDFNIQKRQRFNQQWVCAFHTAWYTNERHPSSDANDDPSRRREIRYGNTIYVLFRALFHLRKYYGPDPFWGAVSRGFNTSPTVVRATVDILTEARRSHRDKPSNDVSDTARAADEWIDFLDNEARSRSQSLDPAIHKEAERFFKSQEKLHLNASRVPAVSRYLPPEEHDAPDRSEDLRNGSRSGPSGRKRSASPPAGPAPKARRFEGDSRRMARPEPDRHGALDELPTIQSTRSPPRRSEAAQPGQPQAAQVQPPKSNSAAGPTRSSTSTNPAPASSFLPTPKREELSETPGLSAPKAPLAFELGSSSNGAAGTNPPTSPSGPKQPVPAPIHPARAQMISDKNDVKSLQAQIESLQNQLVEAKRAKPTTPAAPTPPSATSEQMTKLTQEMASATNAVSTIMESMHAVVDRLDSLHDVVTLLTTEQKELKSTIPQIASTAGDGDRPDINSSNANLDAILGPIQVIATAVTILQTQVADLQSNNPQNPPTTLSHSPTDTTALETLLESQTTRIDTLTQHITTLQRQHLQLHQAQQQQARLSSPNSPHPQPQTLPQVAAAAERDLKYHLGAMERLYHRPGTSKAVKEETENLMATLTEGAMAAHKFGKGL